MISKECFTSEWIEHISKTLNYPDKNLIEKVIRAFSLVEMLVESKCNFIWKGGTSLMLILGQTRHRLSIDVDIICPPGTNIEKYIERFSDYGFISKEIVSRQQRSTLIPKTHSKFHYRIAFNSKLKHNEFILLDVLYEDVHYGKVNELPLTSEFVKWDSVPVKVRVPSVEDMLGDKLTAFAPNTSGIPYFKNEKSQSLQIIKQLYDIGRLFDVMKDFESVKQAYKQIAPIELSYRNSGIDENIALEDTIQTAECLLTRGKLGKGDFASLQNGINRLGSFMYKGKYYIEQAAADAAKAAYIAAALKKNVNFIEKYHTEDIVQRSSIQLPAIIGRLLMSNPEAYFYWSKTAELLL